MLLAWTLRPCARVTAGRGPKATQPLSLGYDKSRDDISVVAGRVLKTLKLSSAPSPLRPPQFLNPVLIYIKIWARTGLLCVDGGPASPYSAKKRSSGERNYCSRTVHRVQRWVFAIAHVRQCEPHFHN